MQVLCKTDWFAGLAFDFFAPGSGFFFGFCFVAVVAECLEVVEVVCASACDVDDVVYFEVLGVAAFDALVVVALEGGFALFVGGASGWVFPHVAPPFLCALFRS